MFKLKLATRFTLLLSLALSGGILLSSLVLSNVLENRAEAEVFNTDRANFHCLYG